MKLKTSITASALALLACSSVNAAVLYNIQFGTSAGTAAVTTSGGALGSSAADIASGATTDTYGYDGGASTMITGGAITAGNNGGGQTKPDVTDIDGKHFSLTVAAPIGSLLDLTSLTFEAVRGTGGTSDRGYEVFAVINGGTFSLTSTKIADQDTLAENRGDTPVLQMGSLAGAEFQGVESVTFRFFPVTGNSTGNLDWGNISVNGDVIPVPEPSSAALLGLGGLALIMRRRK